MIGNLTALLLSSAGPCYFSWATEGVDVYAPLMERLQEIDAYLRSQSPSKSLNGLALQNYLKNAYDRGALVFGGGISAMPSMHVSVATLIALAGYSWQRWIGLALTPFVVVIWIGSIHLGWHYALDGIVAAIMTLLIWALSGNVVKKLGISDDFSYSHCCEKEMSVSKFPEQSSA